MAQLAVPAVIAGSVLSAGSSLMAGAERARASEFEAQQYEQQAEATRTAAIQDEAARRRELTSNLDAVMAIRAGRGVGEASPTGTAIMTSAISRGEEDIATTRANAAAKADLADRSAFLSRRKGQTSMIQGSLGAATSIFSGISRVGGMR